MGDTSEPEVPVICPECETSSSVPLSTLEETIDQHNQRLHNGEDVATVDPAVKTHLTDLIAEDLGLLDDE